MEENATVTLTLEVPEEIKLKEIMVFKENQPILVSENMKVVRTSPSTVEIQIAKVKSHDQGEYSVVINYKEQPLMKLKVIPKPVVHGKIDIGQTTYNEGETLTINCRFDSKPDETFEFMRNGKPLTPDDRISTVVEDNAYTIVVQDLKPEKDEGVYSLKSEHFILETPWIRVIETEKQEELAEKVDVVEQVEEETIVIEPAKKPEVLDIEVVKKEIDNVSTGKHTNQCCYAAEILDRACEIIHFFR